ncbi:MAG TPA: NADH-quinone oxidoreductase subunit M [Mycobacteriales bacterium]|nr:NADH-quinone oxidoreductase subunit M [Mycobacteriales bacterium]
MTPLVNHGFPWVSVLGAIPLVGILAILALPRAREREARAVALVASIVTFAASIAMAVDYKVHGTSFQFTQDYTWIKAFGAHYAVGVDGIALALILMTTALAPICVLASWHDADRGMLPLESAEDIELERGRGPRLFFSLLLATETLVIGVFGSLDVFFFYVLFEAMLIPMYFLIGAFGGARRSYAAVKFLLYSLVGGLLMLVAVIGLYVTSSHQLGHGTFDYRVLLNNVHISHNEQIALFLGFFIAFAIKAPLWPFHTWLPDAASEAPTGTAVMLVGVLDKVGTFGFMRYCIPLFPYASKLFAPYVLGLCVAGILYGALVAIGQKDMKRLVAYSSVSHFGFIALGVFAFTTQGGSGATLYMVNHGFSTGALFLVVGFLASRRGSRMVDDFGGVAKVAPWLGAMVLLAGLSALALPGLSTFISEFLVLVGTFTVHRWFAVVAIAGIVLTALYILWTVQRTVHGPVARAVEDFRDLDFREAWVIAPIMVAIVFLGLFPRALLDRINPSVQRTNSVVRTHDPLPTAALVCKSVGSTGGAYSSTLTITTTGVSCPVGLKPVSGSSNQ